MKHPFATSHIIPLRRAVCGPWLAQDPQRLLVPDQVLARARRPKPSPVCAATQLRFLVRVFVFIGFGHVVVVLGTILNLAPMLPSASLRLNRHQSKHGAYLTYCQVLRTITLSGWFYSEIARASGKQLIKAVLGQTFGYATSEIAVGV